MEATKCPAEFVEIWNFNFTSRPASHEDSPPPLPLSHYFRLPAKPTYPAVLYAHIRYLLFTILLLLIGYILTMLTLFLLDHFRSASKEEESVTSYLTVSLYFGEAAIGIVLLYLGVCAIEYFLVLVGVTKRGLGA